MAIADALTDQRFVIGGSHVVALADATPILLAVIAGVISLATIVSTTLRAKWNGDREASNKTIEEHPPPPA